MNYLKTILLAATFSLTLLGHASDLTDKSPLFSSSEPLDIIIEMDFQKVLGDKSENPKYNAALLIQDLGDNKIKTFNIKVKARGNTRRISEICEFPPLKLNFRKGATENTVFQGQDKIKMVTHCKDNDEYENYAVLEYLAYKTYNALTDYSYKVRLVKVLYRDIRQSYPDIEKSGFLIEDDEAMVGRLGGEISQKKIWSPDSCRQDAVDLFSMFQFMIGNTDWWIHKRHNVDIMALENGELIPIPFDFDYAGIINTPYAIPSPMLPISDVKQRFFKGSCKTILSYEEVIKKFNEKHDDILQVVEETDFINKRLKRSATNYIQSFYKIINDEDKFTQFINNSCEHLYDTQARKK